MYYNDTDRSIDGTPTSGGFNQVAAGRTSRCYGVESMGGGILTVNVCMYEACTRVPAFTVATGSDLIV